VQHGGIPGELQGEISVYVQDIHPGDGRYQIIIPQYVVKHLGNPLVNVGISLLWLQVMSVNTRVCSSF